MFSFKKYVGEKIHHLKFSMSCSAGQAGHLASPLEIINVLTRCLRESKTPWLSRLTNYLIFYQMICVIGFTTTEEIMVFGIKKFKQKMRI